MLLSFPIAFIYLSFFLPLATDTIFLFTNIVIMVNGIIMLLWFISLAILFDKENEIEKKPSVTYFLINILLAGIYMVVSILFQLFGINLLENIVFILIHLYSMYAIAYGLYFLSKSLVMLEKNRNVSFREYIKTLLLIWFYPIGVWFVHPRVKQVLNHK